MRVVIACFFLLSVAARAPLSAQADDEPSGSIGGVVVDAATGEPIRNAEVWASRSGIPPVYRTATDGEGRFLLRELDSGVYQLSTMHPRFLRLGQADRPRIDLGPGETSKGMRIALIRPAVLEGSVIDEYGDPAIGVNVTASRVRSRGGDLEIVGSASRATDDRGVFRVPGLEPGRYAIAAQRGSNSTGNFVWQPAPDDPDGERLSMSYPRTYYPNSLELSGAALLELSAGQEVGGLLFTLTPRRTFSIAGRLIDPLRRAGTYSSPDLRTTPTRGPVDWFTPEQVDDKGNFLFRGLLPGAYLLTADREEPRAAHAWLSLELTDRSIQGADLTLTEGVSVRGRLAYEGVDGTVAGARTRVSLHPEGIPDFEMNVTADPTTGEFEVAGVPAATYRIEAQGYDAVAHRHYFLTGVRAGGTPLADNQLIVGIRDVTELEVALAPAVRLSGVVVSDDGTPSRGAVVLLAYDADDWDLERPTAVTDQRGGFTFQGLLPGYRILYALDRYDAGVDGPDELRRLLRGKGTEVTVEKAGEHQVELRLVRRDEE